MSKKYFLWLAALAAAIMLAGAGCAKGSSNTAGTAGSGKITGGGGDITDVCKYFPKEIVEEAMGKPIVRAANDGLASSHACYYYTAYTQDFNHSPYGDSPGGSHVIVVLNDEDESVERASFEKQGYKFEKDPSFSWDSYVVTSPGSKKPFRVDLIVDSGHYFMIKSNHFAATDVEIVKIGKRLSEKIKNGK